MIFHNVAMIWIQWILLMKSLLGNSINLKGGNNCEHPC